jgi:ATP synthase mitochondrial F1 complex assembly factor 2
MERATYATKSFLISLALVQGEISTEQAADASRVEVLSQIKRWGEVEDCMFFGCALNRNFEQILAHDVDHHEIRLSLGSAACALVNAS